MNHSVSRRALCRSAALAAAGSIISSRDRDVAAETAYSSVLCSAPPDPAPPGVADFAIAAFNAWQRGHDAYITYDPIAWPRLFQRLQSYFEAGLPVYDLMYLASWIPEFHKSLLPLADKLPQFVPSDVPESSWKACSWSGEVLGCQSTLSLLT